MKKVNVRNQSGKNAPAKDVDDYIAAAPEETRARLAQLHKVIKAAMPKADESISYGMPFYKYRGARVSFAVFKNHIGLFGVSSVIEEHRQELAAFRRTPKGPSTSHSTSRYPSCS